MQMAVIQGEEMTINFCVVFRINDHFYIPRRAEECEGITPSEAWLLGTPKTKNEADLHEAAWLRLRSDNSHHIP